MSSNNQMQLMDCQYSSIRVFIYVQSKDISFEDIAQGRGPRVVEQGHKSECVTEKEWAACTDDDWVRHSHFIYDTMILFFFLELYKTSIFSAVEMHLYLISAINPANQ